MVLHPQARAAVEASAAVPPVWSPGCDIAAARAGDRETALAGPREDVAEVVDVDADGVRCRLYRPADALDGTIVHLHGGGFVFNDIDVHDAAARMLANRAGMAVLSIDYRSTPAWASRPIEPGTTVEKPTPVFTKLDTGVVDEELARLGASPE